MTRWDVRPHIGLGPLQLGMSQAQAEDVLGPADARDTQALTWSSPAVRALLRAGRVTGVRLERDGIEARWQAMDLLGVPADTLLATLRRRGHHVVEEVEGEVTRWRIDKLGLTLEAGADWDAPCLAVQVGA